MSQRVIEEHRPQVSLY